MSKPENTLLRKKLIRLLLSKEIEQHRKLLKTLEICDNLGITDFCVNVQNENVRSSMAMFSGKSLPGLFVDGDFGFFPKAWELAKKAELGMKSGDNERALIQNHIIPNGYYFKRKGKWFLQGKSPIVPSSEYIYLIRNSIYKTFLFRSKEIILERDLVVLRLKFGNNYKDFIMGGLESKSLPTDFKPEWFNLFERINGYDYQVEDHNYGRFSFKIV